MGEKGKGREGEWGKGAPAHHTGTGVKNVFLIKRSVPKFNKASHGSGNFPLILQQGSGEGQGFRLAKKQYF